VQKTKTDKRNNQDFSPDEGTRLYEPEYETQQRFEHEAFLTQILERGEGKTEGKQIAVIGEPGAGKTTLLQAIAFWVLENNLGLPIWISLADLGRKGNLTDIQTYIGITVPKKVFCTLRKIMSFNGARRVRDNGSHKH
jgi:predicted NACHT family NTPase